MLNAKLVVVGGEVKSTEIKLKLPCIIGRGKGSTVMLPHPLVSRQHCELFESNGTLWVRDLGSLNGTYVNNEKVTETQLPPNELLTVGTVTFRALYEPLVDANPPSGVAQFLQSTARPEDDQPTVRVDSPTNIGHFVPPGVVSAEEISLDEMPVEGTLEEGMPSAPLFEETPTPPPKTVPMPQQRQAKPQQQNRPIMPVAIPVAVTPTPVLPVAPEPEPAVQAENAEEDDDFQDFLKNLGGKK